MPRLAFILVLILALGDAASAASAQDLVDPAPSPAFETASPASESSPHADRVCLYLPLTGPHAALGARVARAVEGALLPGSSLLLRKGDTRGAADEAAALVRRAAEEGCALVIGGLGDRESRAMADAAEAVGMPLLALGAAPDGRERRGVAWVRTPRSELGSELGRRLAIAGARRASAVVLDSEYAGAVARAFRAAFEAAGGTVLSWQPLAGDGRAAARAVGEAVKAARAADPCVGEAVLVAADLVRARRVAAFLEYEGALGAGDAKCPAPALVGTPLWDDPAALARSGDALRGAVFPRVAVPWPPSDGATLLEAEAADAGALARALLKARSGAGPAGVTAALAAGVSWTGASGDLRVAAGRVTGREIVLMTVDRSAAAPASVPPPVGSAGTRDAAPIAAP